MKLADALACPSGLPASPQPIPHQGNALAKVPSGSAETVPRAAHSTFPELGAVAAGAYVKEPSSVAR